MITFSAYTDQLNLWKSMIFGINFYIQHNLNDENEKKKTKKKKKLVIASLQT